MSTRFFSWYTQAIGSTIGIFVCLYAYAKGNMYVYGNIGPNFDNLSIFGMISSYLLYPLCFATLCFSFIKIYLAIKDLDNTKFLSINKTLVFTTTVVGLMSSIYFIIPATLILFDYHNYIFDDIIAKSKEFFIILKDKYEKDKYKDNSEANSKDHIVRKSINTPSNKMKYLSTREEMALDLLKNDSDLEFIHDITGLTNSEILKLKDQLNTVKIK